MGLQNPTITSAMNTAVLNSGSNTQDIEVQQNAAQEQALIASMDGLLPWCEKGISWMIGEETEIPNSPAR